jgi:hypothetical protein
MGALIDLFGCCPICNNLPQWTPIQEYRIYSYFDRQLRHETDTAHTLKGTLI